MDLVGILPRQWKLTRERTWKNAWKQSPCARLEDFASIRDELFAITPLESLEALPFSLPHLMGGQYLDP